MSERENILQNSNQSISFVVPLYNQEQYVLECLNSLFRVRNVNVQVVIIDDSSKDNSAAVVDKWISENSRENFEIIFLKNETNSGVCKTLNRGVKASKYDIINICAADDFMLPDSIPNKLEFLNSHKYDALISDVCIINNESEITHESGFLSYFNANAKALAEDKLLIGEIVTNWCVPGPCLLIKKKAYDVIGYYDPQLIAEDRDFYLRLLRGVKVHFDFLPIAAYRVHNTNISRESTFRKKMNHEIRVVNAGYANQWSGLNRLFLKTYSLGLNDSNRISKKISLLIGAALRKLLRLVFNFKVLVTYGK
jgi:glycosyltransferase involved in cell wall biosynthesis